LSQNDLFGLMLGLMRNKQIPEAILCTKMAQHELFVLNSFFIVLLVVFVYNVYKMMSFHGIKGASLSANHPVQIVLYNDSAQVVKKEVGGFSPPFPFPLGDEVGVEPPEPPSTRALFDD